jgi:hypothetical protein
MSLNKVIPKSIFDIRIRVSIGELNIIDAFAVMLNPEIKILAVDEKLWEIVKLRD